MKKIFRHPATVRAIAAIVSGYVYFVFATSRVKVITPLPVALTHGPVVLASWHQQILMIPVMHKRNPSKLLALISSSRAGTFIQAVAKWYGIGTIEGSTRRGGSAGARMLIKAARDGNSLYITPDGSSGPACIAKEGATEVARLTRMPLIPCAAWPSRGKTFNTWDSFRFPYPFSIIRVAYGEPLQNLRPQDLSDSLNALTAHVQRTPD
jgi:lysophospholipid acyltransferase (LPLAT)-like uncharacterized protein